MKILEFPQLRQTYSYDCGANAVQSVLAYYGHDIRADKIMKLAGTTKKIGTLIEGIKNVLRKYDLNFRAGRMSISKIKKSIEKGLPVILALQAWSKNKRTNYKKDWANGHYVVAIGYDNEKIYFEDPSTIPRTYLENNELKKRWHDVDIKGKKYRHFGIIVYGEKKYKKTEDIVHMD